MNEEILEWSKVAVCIAFLAALAVILGLVAGNQYLGVSRDYQNYLEFFELVRSGDGLLDIETRFEFGFAALVYWLVRLGLGNVAIYGVICAICVMIKGFAIRMSELSIGLIAILLFFYLSRYFILFEMTVLRASVAFAIIFFVFWRKRDFDFHLDEFVLLLIAVGFHYSAVVVLAVYFLGRLKPSGVILLVLLIFLFGVLAKDLLFVEFQAIFPVLSSYQELDARATTLPIPFMLDIALVVVAVYLWDESDVAMKYSVIGLLLSIAIHFSMLELPIIAARFRELLSVFVLIYIARASLSASPWMRGMAIGFALLSGVLNFYAMTVYDPLLL